MNLFERFRRLAYQAAHGVRYVYWFLVLPRTYGVQLVVVRRSEVLLVRHSYMHRTKWALPGGGMHRRENALACARREAQEELALEGDFRELGNVDLYHDFHRDLVRVFVVNARSEDLQLDEAEIVEARWFATDRLPANLTPLAHHILKTAAFPWRDVQQG